MTFHPFNPLSDANPARVQAALERGHATAAARDPGAVPDLRERVAARLGLDADASNEAVFAALDGAGGSNSDPVDPAKIAAPAGPGADLYDLAWGGERQTRQPRQPLEAADQSLYAKAWGDDEKGA
ncbi:hypothetical protein EDM22_12310 [Agromyces tardus]|uniref:Uncharacterized protein n=1 Tax=Agromyces tardus TaxID=2583849 RepID=A0A3M8A9Z0_9MICO|nr:hypothetical protein [Agromyces tardus]RNB47407.1 hypothetical protein EDM22_12310 [Agromyces tardus]